MNNELVAIRDGKYEFAIELALSNLEKSPDNISSHFTLAQSYEAKKDYENALAHSDKCMSAIPDSFEILSLAARCKASLRMYDEAYEYACKALENSKDQDLPRWMQALYKFLSYVPGLKFMKNINEDVVGGYEKQSLWLQEFIEWYTKKSPNKKPNWTAAPPIG